MGASVTGLTGRALLPVTLAVFLACSQTTAPKAPHSSPGSACGSAPPLAGIYQPDRLQVIDPCRHAVGLVVSVVPEGDGDYHLWIVLDPAYTDLMNAENHFQGKPTMLAEIVPDCGVNAAPPDSSTANKCPPTKLTVPTAGRRIAIDGPWVLDTNHGWQEIHPVDTIVIVGS